jgi:hypothetical protein
MTTPRSDVKDLEPTTYTRYREGLEKSFDSKNI